MRSKKLLSLALSGLMVVPTVMPIMASDDKSTTVSYEVEQSYEWSIHSAIDFGKDKGSGQSVSVSGNVVSVSGNVIPEGGHLNISVAGDGQDNEFIITDGAGTNLNYAVYKDATKLVTGENVLSVEAGTNTDFVYLNFVLNTGDNESEIAGDYSGTVTYTATVVAEHTHNYVAQTEMKEYHVAYPSGTVIVGDPNEYILNNDIGDVSWKSEWREEVVSYKCSICGNVISIDEYNNLNN